MPPEIVTIIDFLRPSDPVARRLLSIEELARERWRCSPEFAKRRLQAAGIHLVRVGYPELHVRKSDVKELEQAMTVYLKARKKPNTALVQRE